MLLWLIFILLCLWIPPMFHPAFEQEIQTAQQSEYGNLTSQERVCLVDHNSDALLWRLRLTESARDSIVLSTFEWFDDNSGTDMMAALYHAADRGVQVQLLVDGISGFLHLSGNSSFQALAAHPNVEVRFYNPVNLLLPWRLNYRMHDKYLIADNHAFLLGGRNVGDLFLGNDTEASNEDLDILVYETEAGKGASYLQLTEYFQQIWSLPCCKPYKPFPWLGIADIVCDVRRSQSAQELEARYQHLRRTYPEAFEAFDWLQETQKTEGITLLSGQNTPRSKTPAVWKSLMAEMQGSTELIAITPYIICDKEMYQDLEKLTENGSRLCIVINAAENGANPFGCTDYINQKEKILATGASVCEYWGEQSLHTKAILAGDDTSMIGSCNMDIRSVYLDTELMLLIKSEAFNQELRLYADRLKSQGVTVAADGEVQPGSHYAERPLPFGKKLLYGILRVLIIPIRHLL